MNIKQLNERLERVLNENSKNKAYKYQGYTFIPKGVLSIPHADVMTYTKHNSKLNTIFDKSNGTWDYDNFYKNVPSDADVFAIKELDNILIVPATNYLFEWTGDETTYHK